VAGTFYTDDPRELRNSIERWLEASTAEGPPPKAYVLPHAGHVYSGPIAATGYAHLMRQRGTIRRVVLLGPSHRVPLRGMAVPTVQAFNSPLGDVLLDTAAIDAAAALPFVDRSDRAHTWEHSLEVHLPFLQIALGDFLLVPVVAGDASEDEAAELLDLLWGGDETAVVVSSDLSHYHRYTQARAIDQRTAENIESLDGARITSRDACGYVGIRGLLRIAREKGLAARIADLRSSGDTAGPRDQVVGYGAFLFS
jgi:AmmeMemoRadiSam system protein B